MRVCLLKTLSNCYFQQKAALRLTKCGFQKMLVCQVRIPQNQRRLVNRQDFYFCTPVLLVLFFRAFNAI